ncbi:MAG TPA: gluconate 2-dehydrogenase subunit 3 family protein [Steroidobacter sp.]
MNKQQTVDERLSRRLFLSAAAGMLGVASLPFEWAEAAHAAHEAVAAQRGDAVAFNFLTTNESADVAAIAAQIIPTDQSPGAQEAGVVYFIDRALGTLFPRLASDFRSQLAEFVSFCRNRNSGAASFAALSSEQQIELLHAVEHTPFFATMRLLTVLGMFSMPAYGGNGHNLGWTLLGFEDQHAFAPPFGYYDRDYPGFEIAGKESA